MLSLNEFIAFQGKIESYRRIGIFDDEVMDDFDDIYKVFMELLIS